MHAIVCMFCALPSQQGYIEDMPKTSDNRYSRYCYDRKKPSCLDIRNVHRKCALKQEQENIPLTQWRSN